MRPNPGKPYPHKPFQHHLHAKKHKPIRQQRYHQNRPEPDRVQKLESLQVDIVPNTMEYLLVTIMFYISLIKQSRHFLEDGQASPSFSLLESLNTRVNIS